MIYFCNAHVQARSSNWSGELDPWVQPSSDALCNTHVYAHSSSWLVGGALLQFRSLGDFCDTRVYARSSTWSAKPSQPLILGCNPQLTYILQRACVLAVATCLAEQSQPSAVRCNFELPDSASHVCMLQPSAWSAKPSCNPCLGGNRVLTYCAAL